MLSEVVKAVTEVVKGEGAKVVVKELGKNVENIRNSFSEVLSKQMDMIKTTSMERLSEINNPITNDANDNISTEVKKMPTRNEGLEGKNHPETGVPFVTKIVENSDGELVEVVVPEFDSVFEAQLPDEVCEANDNAQFDECNKQLKEAIENNPELREKFTDEQIEQIMDGETPDGFTWHHDAEKGKMQLVDSEIHAKTGHTGGKSIWGGGTENR